MRALCTVHGGGDGLVTELLVRADARILTIFGVKGRQMRRAGKLGQMVPLSFFLLVI